MDSKQSLLDKLLREGEGEKVDFKQKINDKRKIAKTLTSFANHLGGYIIVGVKDDKTIIDIDPEEEKYMLNEAANFYCSPPVELMFEEIEDEESGNTLLLVTIPESKQKPHSAKINENEWKVYLRQSDKSMIASQLNLSLMRKGVLRNNAAALTDLEAKLIDYLQSHEKITLKQFMKLFNLGKRRANRVLTGLVVEGLIKVNDLEKEDFYTI